MDRRIVGEGAVKRTRTGSGGFSLLEVLVAMTITVTVMLAILGMFDQAYRLYARNKRLTVATNLAATKLADFKAMTVGAIVAENPKTETIVREGIPYTVNWTVSNVDVDGDSVDDLVGDLVKISLDVNYAYRGGAHRVSMATMTTGVPQ